ncbi:MAG: hypothetical protein HN368_04460 [Spirochaetales bacterium]|jgi:hypothetical protein|nr:hypothetical protein [Spirochaetales bacterium]
MPDVKVAVNRDALSGIAVVRIYSTNFESENHFAGFVIYFYRFLALIAD